VPVNRGLSFATCSTAIAAVVVADALAREQREKAAQRRREETVRAALRRPERTALVDGSHSVLPASASAAFELGLA
jgi:hypothetical protein